MFLNTGLLLSVHLSEGKIAENHLRSIEATIPDDPIPCLLALASGILTDDLKIKITDGDFENEKAGPRLIAYCWATL
jgi:hypothetical protein